MESKKQTPKYTAEFRERGVRLYREQRFQRVQAGPRQRQRGLPCDRVEARLFP